MIDWNKILEQDGEREIDWTRLMSEVDQAIEDAYLRGYNTGVMLTEKKESGT